MNLTPPPPTTRVMRRMPDFEHSKPGKWHFLKRGSEVKARCGMFMSVSRQLEYSTLGEIHGALCPMCWPWEE